MTLDLAGPSLHSNSLLDLVYDCFDRDSPFSSSCLISPQLFTDTVVNTDADQKIPVYDANTSASSKEDMKKVNDLIGELASSSTESQSLTILRLL